MFLSVLGQAPFHHRPSHRLRHRSGPAGPMRHGTGSDRVHKRPGHRTTHSASSRLSHVGTLFPTRATRSTVDWLRDVLGWDEAPEPPQNASNSVSQVDDGLRGGAAHHPYIVYCPLATFLAPIFFSVSKIWL